MIHAEYLTGNPLTGKQVWLVRRIDGEYGADWDFGLIAMKEYHFSKTAYVMGLSGEFGQWEYDLVTRLLAEMGFHRMKYMRRGRERFRRLVSS